MPRSLLSHSPVPALVAEREMRRRAFGFLARQLALWWSRLRERRALARLSDDQLTDIGLSRVDAAREAAKPFWQP